MSPTIHEDDHQYWEDALNTTDSHCDEFDRIPGIFDLPALRDWLLNAIDIVVRFSTCHTDILLTTCRTCIMIIPSLMNGLPPSDVSIPKSFESSPHPASTSTLIPKALFQIIAVGGIGVHLSVAPAGARCIIGAILYVNPLPIFLLHGLTCDDNRTLVNSASNQATLTNVLACSIHVAAAVKPWVLSAPSHNKVGPVSLSHIDPSDVCCHQQISNHLHLV
jgi:hypothetical protein